MRSERLVGLVDFLVALLLAGCFGEQASVKYQAADESASTQPVQWTFDTDSVGGPPKGAEAFSGAWTVRTENGAPSSPNALCQTATAEYPALSLEDAVYADVVVSTRFKPISGRTDQAAGVIARVQDRGNYYILRANALEGNVTLYKYAGGRRSRLKDASAQVVAGQWQELRLEVVGARLRGFLNGQPMVEATDETYKAGKVGLWTKADSVTCFDDVEARTP